MDGVQFADGFDAPDRLAFGLGAGQLLTVVCGGVLALLVLHAPLPGPIDVAVAGMLALGGAMLGWLRLAGRPALDWAVFAVRHAVLPSEGKLTVSAAPAASNVIPLHSALAFDPPSSADGAAPRGLQRQRSPAAARSGAHRIVFFSLKGGTGRTTLATEVATALAIERALSAGGPVALIDLDLRCASVGARLGLSQLGIIDYAAAHPDTRTLEPFTVHHSTGLRVMLGPLRSTSPDWPVTPPVVREVLRELDMDGASVVVIDVSPEWSVLTRAALVAADEVIVVIQPTASGIQDAYRTTEALRTLGLHHRLRYVVNRERAAVDVSVVLRDLGGELLAAIPDDFTIIDAENRHTPVVTADQGAAAIELRRLARRIVPSSTAVAVT